MARNPAGALFAGRVGADQRAALGGVEGRVVRLGGRVALNVLLALERRELGAIALRVRAHLAQVQLEAVHLVHDRLPFVP